MFAPWIQAGLGPFEAQVTGDYVGKRYVTYLNDLSVGGTLLTGLEASYIFDSPWGAGIVKDMKISANVTNLAGIRGTSTAVVTSNTGGYQAYPMAPRMFFVTLSAKLE
jgi:iron complex outermembrane receptor protein